MGFFDDFVSAVSEIGSTFIDTVREETSKSSTSTTKRGFTDCPERYPHSSSDDWVPPQRPSEQKLMGMEKVYAELDKYDEQRRQNTPTPISTYDVSTDPMWTEFDQKYRELTGKEPGHNCPGEPR